MTGRATVRASLRESIQGSVPESVRTLAPGYFALVMATGIVSVGMRGEGAGWVSVALLWVAAVAYLVLTALNGYRLVRFREQFRADLRDPTRAFGFFTFVAGSDVLGTRLIQDGRLRLGMLLLGIGCAAWFLLGYLIPWLTVLGRTERPVVSAANGTWFIWVVASQSVAVLAAGLEPLVGTGRRELALLAVGSWSVGAFLYPAVGIFVSARLLLYEVSPAELNPPYWVSMGATAITVVAGARIVRMASAPMVDATRGLVAGTSVVFWAFGSWLIPALIAAGWWRHARHGVPLRYEASLWSVAFPIGMYGVAGQTLGAADHLPIVSAVGHLVSWFALAVWAVLFLAMLGHLARLPTSTS